ncbi:MAG TPA: hypothetical protein VF165_07510 [Nocardioidaceae bacterium]
MNLSNHPIVAMELARYRMEEEIAQAEAYRAAHQASLARKAEQRAARDSRAVAHSRGVSLLTVLRGSVHHA